MAVMLKSSDLEFKKKKQTTVIHMPREYQFLMGNVTSMNKQMGNISRKMKILEDSKKNTLQIKNPVTEIKNAFGEHIHKLDRAKEIT